MTATRAPWACLAAIAVLTLSAFPARAAHVVQTPAAPTSPDRTAQAAQTPLAQQPIPQLGAPAFRDAASGVEVYAALDAEMFPPTWREASIGAAARSLAVTDTARAVRLIEVALSKYPAPLLKLNLERVYVVGALQFRGIYAAGTNSSDRLYIVVDGADPLYTDGFVEETFHHEFSHLLRRNYPDFLTDVDWRRNNPPDFQYGAPSGVDAVKTGHASLLANDDWNRRGFMSEYGAEDPAEDFATISGSLFTGNADFWQRADHFTALGTKIKAAVGFFAHLSPSFTESYFRGLHPGLAYVPRPIATPTIAPALTPVAPAEPANAAAGQSPPTGAPIAKP